MTYSPNFRGNNSLGSSRSTSTGYTNAGMIALNQASPLSIDTNGKVLLVDVSSDISVHRFVGLASKDIPGVATGEVVDSGRLENVVIGYAVGDALWVSKAGFLINQPPAAGVNGFVSGDHVIFVGVIVKNQFDISKKDIKLMIEKVGKL